MAEMEDTGTKYVADLAYVLKNNKESFYDPELVTSKGGELVKSKLVKSKLEKSEIGKSACDERKERSPHSDSTNPG